jgi:hypothetical protein
MSISSKAILDSLVDACNKRDSQRQARILKEALVHDCKYGISFVEGNPLPLHMRRAYEDASLLLNLRLATLMPQKQD